MLTHLRIENLALVDRAELSFSRGMTVVTGETGAGKSVLVAALALALGDRADKDQIRHGATDALVEATFSVDQMPQAWRTEVAPYVSDNQLTITRTISRENAGRVKIGGVNVPLARLKEIAEPLAEILGQHASQLLLQETAHLQFLDRFAQVESLRDDVSSHFHEWQRAVEQLNELERRRLGLAEERELLLFQAQEIEKAEIVVGEEEQLTAEKKVLESAKTLIAASDLIVAILDSEESSVLRQLRYARREAEKMAAVDTYVTRSASQLAEAEYLIEEIRRTIEQYGSGIHDDPARLDEVNSRLDELYRLKKKYGGSESSILETLETINQKLTARPDSDKMIDYLSKEIARSKKLYAEKGIELAEIRRKAADYLQKLVVRELAGMAIESARFMVEFIAEPSADPDGIDYNNERVTPHPYGLENCRFLFSANPGEPVKPLVKVASGGEVSRLLLALKLAEKRNLPSLQPVMIFDEVDAGIGGKTAVEIGKRMAALAKDCQVIVVTHLHQIARKAEHHFVVEKSKTKGNRTVITVRPLDRAGIQDELDRMLSLPSEA